MLELVKGYHKRTGLTKTVLVISISVCINIPYSTVSIGTLQGLQWFIQNFLLTVFVLSGFHCIIWLTRYQAVVRTQGSCCQLLSLH